MKTIRNFPRYFENEDCPSLGKTVSVTEVKNIFKLFAKDKGPGPDGCTVEFFGISLTYLGKIFLMQWKKLKFKEKIIRP